MLTTAQHGTNSDKVLAPWLFPTEQIPYAWDDLEPFVEECLRTGEGQLSTEHVRQMLFDGSATAFGMLRDGQLELVLVVQVVDYSFYRAARVITCSGKGLFDSAPFVELLDAWALMQGAVEIEAWVKPQMARMLETFGYSHKRAIVTRDLRRHLQ